MICLSCNLWRTKLVFPIFKTMPIEYIATHSTNKNRIAHYINPDNKTAKIPIGGICKKCVRKGVAREYNPKIGWREAFKQWAAKRRVDVQDQRAPVKAHTEMTKTEIKPGLAQRVKEKMFQRKAI